MKLNQLRIMVTQGTNLEKIQAKKQELDLCISKKMSYRHKKDWYRLISTEIV